MSDRIDTIRKLCVIAGCPDRVPEFLMGHKSIPDVLAALSGQRAKTPSEHIIGARVRVHAESAAGPVDGADDDAAWRRLADAPRPDPTPRRGATRTVSEVEAYERFNQLSPETIARRQWRPRRRK